MFLRAPHYQQLQSVRFALHGSCGLDQKQIGCKIAAIGIAWWRVQPPCSGVTFLCINFVCILGRDSQDPVVCCLATRILFGEEDFVWRAQNASLPSELDGTMASCLIPIQSVPCLPDRCFWPL